MTQEEKAKAYDKALERAKKWCNAPNIEKIPTFGNRIIEEIFPELAESEDERIRKGLIALLKFGLEDGSAIAPGFNETKEQALAWLEKQKDMVAKLIISDEGYNKAFQDGIEEALTNPHKYGLEKQGKEQKIP